MPKNPPKGKKPVPSPAVKSKSATPQLPARIFAQASPRSLGGVSLFDVQGQVNSGNVGNFHSDPEVIQRAVERLLDAGFEVLQVSEMTINIAGSAKTFEKAFKTTIAAQERPAVKELGRLTTATFIDCPDTQLSGLIPTAGTSMGDLLEGVAIEEPRYYMSPSMYAPLKSYWHLRVPADISLATNADKAHRTGITGKGVKVAMVDSGHYLHPFFTGRGYRVAPVTLGPGAANPLKDESGHGTGESANIFAVAPDAQLLPVKMNFANTVGAFNAAVGLGPDIITCSWGSSKQFGPLSASDQALAAAISAAVAADITVIFSAGNGHWGFPGQHPEVVSAGGTFMRIDESLQASDYASGFMSNIYPGRRVPDLSGLVGMQPKAIYIMLPVEPGDSIDSTPWNAGGLQGGTHPNGDETTNSDGWGAFSGTSAAAPQLAGAAALVKQACAALSPQRVRSILMSTARDVAAGNCNPATGGNPAVPGPDTATGNGLVDAHKAVLTAKVQCLGPIRPITPRTPVTGITPITSITPVTSITPITPVTGITPPRPITPITRITPIRPITPTTAISPPGPSRIPEPIRPGSGESYYAAPPAPRLTEEDVEALEKLIQEGDLDLG